MPDYYEDFQKTGLPVVRLITWSATIALLLLSEAAIASDWEEETPPNSTNKQNRTSTTHDPESLNSNQENHKNKKRKSSKEKQAPLQGKVEKLGSKSTLRIPRSSESGHYDQETDPGAQNSDLQGKAIDSELRGAASELGLRDLSPLTDQSAPLQGRAALQDSKKGQEIDPDADDSELLVEWDRWRNRFLRAVQLGTQENINNPDPDEYERPRIDPLTGTISRRYPLGTGAAFSCIVTADGQIKNLEIIEASGFPKYDRAVLRAVQQLAGTQILRFPKGSHRRNIMQPGRIKTATSNSFRYHHFGDVEKITQP